jgi:DNA-binding XRE family transcriptional regulator
MFISRVKELRIKRGLNQSELGLLVGLSQMGISNIERGANTNINTLVDLTRALDCCLYDLFIFKCDNYQICTSKRKSLMNCYENDECKEE